MGKSYQVYVEDGITICRFSEVAEHAALEKAIKEALELDETGLRLWVFAKGTNISTGELKGLIALSDGRQRKPSKAAFVATDDLTFGLARMQASYREGERLSSRVFRDEAEALAWLRG